MNEQPFDITDLPIFPFVPGGAYWCAIGALCAAFIVLHFGSKRRRRGKQPLSIALDDIRNIEKSSFDVREKIHRICLLVKRALWEVRGEPYYPSLGISELRRLAREDTELKPIIEALARLHELEYAPTVPEIECIDSLKRSLSEWVNKPSLIRF